MKKLYLVVFVVLFTISNSFANNFSSPGTGVKWTLTELVANSGGDVTFSGGEYFVNDTVFIALKDTLSITADAVVKFITGSYFDINGTLIINPPTNVTFTAQNVSTGFLGMRIDSSNSTVLRKLTFEYANSLRLFDCVISIDSCVFRYNSPTTSWGNGAVSLNRAHPVITNSTFIDNQRAAVQGGSNIGNAPKIYNCLFQRNVSLNTNTPQINLGATSSGNDTVKIINNRILGGSIMSGGIGFLPLGNVYAVITGNTIRNNRYGLTFSGGSTINALISYNVVDSNNIQNDPNLGGSGISFTGGSATSHQNSIVTGNIFRANLWGITIQNFAKPNIGDLSNTDTTDDGKNYFINNTNATTPGIDLYNNSPDPIMAQNNYWNVAEVTAVEAKVFHQADNAALGLVNYQPIYTVVPIALKQFSVVADKNNTQLIWQTATEQNSSFFAIEKSKDARTFNEIAKVNANGNASNYGYNDVNAFLNESIIYYRLRMVDKDGKFIYSPTLSVKKNGEIKNGTVKIYPTIAAASQTFNAEIVSDKKQHFTLRFMNASGQVLNTLSATLQKGKNILSLKANKELPKGQVYLLFNAENFVQTVPVFVN